MLDRAAALALVHEYTGSDALRKHMYAVEIAMRAMAGQFGADPEYWGIIGLVHDFDYERFPNPSRSATEEHPAAGVRILAGHDTAIGVEAGGAGQGDDLVAQRLQPGELQHGIVVVAEIVDSDDRLSPREQGSGDMGADETGDTCNED